MAGKPFTNVEMMLLADISYEHMVSQHFNPDGSAKGKVTLAQLLKANKIGDELYKKYDEGIVAGLLEKADQFTVIKSYEDRLNSGFAAFALEGPEKGTVTVAARGSQFKVFPDGIIDAVADLQLGVESETMQQRAMNNFMKDLSAYDSIYLTGHSLGGNLAVSGAVGFKYPSKIKGVMTFNAPGQNAAFMAENAINIKQLKSKIINFQNEGDIVSDINIPVGEVFYVKSRTKDSFELTNKFENHFMQDFEYGKYGFQFSNSPKKAPHYAFQFSLGIRTSALSALVKLLESYGYGKLLSEAKKRRRNQIYENASHQNVVVVEHIYMNPDALRVQADMMALEQTVFDSVVQQIRNLVITLKDEHIWDSPATNLFIENYLELHENFIKFSRALKEYSDLMKNHSYVMEEIDQELANKIYQISLK